MTLLIFSEIFEYHYKSGNKLATEYKISVFYEAIASYVDLM